MTRKALCPLLFAAFLAAGTALGNVYSVTNGAWNDADTWDPGIPATTDDVIIRSGDTVTISGLSTIHINSLSVSGILEHTANGSTEAHKIILEITNDCIVALGGKIDVTARGYSSGGPGVPSAGYSGGSHGGRGGLNGGDVDDAGITYGSLTAPVDLGSAASDGSDGGGAVKLTVGGTTTVDGGILANGQDDSTFTGGAGGSVFITTANFGGSGSVTANGGYNGGGETHGAGGGGRVAVVLTSGSSFGSVDLRADRGCGTDNKGGQNGYSSAGTVYTKTPSQTHGTLKIDNSGYGLYEGSDDLTPGTYIPSNQTWQLDKLVLTNSGNLFVGPDATLSITNGNFGNSTTNESLVVIGTIVLPAELSISNITFMPHWDSTLFGLSNLTIKSGAVLKHLDNYDDERYRLDIDIPGDFTLEAGAQIDVTGLGYDQSQGPGVPSYNYSGGSHGGRGGLSGAGISRALAGPTYGSLSSPTNCGSGGSNQGAGGGVVRITAAGTTTINGEILAEGGDGVQYDSGSGGSVFITTADFAGSGTISANGGFESTGNHGAGGGGRIAVVLNSGSTFGSVDLTAYAGGGGSYGGNSGFPSAGTIYTKTPSQTYGKVNVNNNGAGLWAGGGLTPGTYIPAGATWQVDQVELVNGGALWIGDTSTLEVSDTSPSTTNGSLINEGTLSVPGDFIATNITFMPIAGSSFSGLTNLTVANGAIVSHVDNHAAEDWKLELTVPGNLTINAGGAIDVDGKGYWRGNGPAGGGNYGMGGGYGGEGGEGRDGQDEDPTYGSITSPTNIGSAGQRYTSDETDGGGAAKITVGGTTTIDGTISASGKSTTTYLDGGGAGGSVWLTTSNLVGAGTIRADGGSAANASTSGGGGGRIAVHLTGSDSFGSVAMQAYGATGNRKGAAGTVYKQTESQGAGKGTLIVDNNGLVTTHGEYTQVSSAVTGTEVGDVIIRNAGHFEVNASQSITVYGSWSNGYAFTAGLAAEVWLAGTDAVTVFGDNSFDSLVCSNVSKQIDFEAGYTQSVDTVFAFRGPSDTSLLLRSTSPGTQWGLDLDGGVVMNIEYVDVQDSDARPGTGATASNSRDSGSNSNWNFSAGGIQTNIWIGEQNATWGNGNNWTLNRTPLPADDRVIFSNGNYQATLPSAQTFNNLSVWPGATLSLGGFDLAVNNETIVQGSITPSGGETMTFGTNLTVSGGTLTVVGSQEIYVGGNIDFTGGTFTKATSHVILNGDVAQSITSDGESFSTLTASNQSATVTFADAVTATTYYSRHGNVTYGGNFDATMFDVNSENGAVTHTFEGGSTYTFQEMWLRGTSGKTQHLESSSTAAWHLNVTAVANVQNVNVEYSDAAPGVEIQAISSIDSGNNTNWNFGPFSVWTGDSSTDFHTAGNWEPEGVPTNTTYIIVDNTTTCNVDSPASVKYAKIGGVNASKMEIESSLIVADNVDVIANGTLEINDDPGMTVSGNVSVASGGLLTHADNSSTEADRMILAVDGNLTIAAGGEIDVTGLGYDRRQGPGTPLYTGDYSGGSHGGRGGIGYDSPTNGGPTYGSLKEPVNLGSGGSDESGATGGGAVRLIVGGTTTVDGKILAVGGDGNSYDSGAGGSVYITTGSLSGSGTISVNGGFTSTGTHGAGGGGRIAVVLTNSSSFGSVTMTAHAGGEGIYGGGQGFPAAGTIYTRVPGQMYGTVRIDNNGAGLWAGGDLTAGTWIPSNHTWQVDVLELTDFGSLWVGSEATLNITSGDFGNSATSGNLVVEGTVVLPGSLTVSNFTFMPHWDSTLSGLTNLTIASCAMASHVPNSDDTGTYKLTIDIPGNLTVAGGGKIDVTGGGYTKTHGPGAPSYTYNGGGHGGQGGLFHNDPEKYGPPGATYGSVLAPTNAGSGPGSGGHATADGGGVVRLIIGGATTVNGQIVADGSQSGEFDGGSGGSVYLTTAALAGSGTISANGGDPYPTQGHTGAGGGGRVAVVLTSGSSFGSVEFSARGGTLGGSGASGPGTVYLEKASDREDGGTVIVDCKGEDARRAAFLPPEIPVEDEDLSEAMLVITGASSQVTLSSNLWVRDILVYTDSYLELGSNTMYVYSREHHIDDLSQRGPGGPTNTVVDYYDQVIWLGVRRPAGSFLLLR